MCSLVYRAQRFWLKFNKHTKPLNQDAKHSNSQNDTTDNNWPLEEVETILTMGAPGAKMVQMNANITSQAIKKLYLNENKGLSST